MGCHVMRIDLTNRAHVHTYPLDLAAEARSARSRSSVAALAGIVAFVLFGFACYGAFALYYSSTGADIQLPERIDEAPTRISAALVDGPPGFNVVLSPVARFDF